MSAANDFCAELAALCTQYGYRSIDVRVGCDGTVEFVATSPRGYNVTGTQWAYLPTPGIVDKLPTPEQTLARWQHVQAEGVCK